MHTCLHTNLHTYLPTYFLASLFTYLLPYFLIYLLIYFCTYLLTYLFTYLLTYLFAYLLTYLQYLRTYLPTYLLRYNIWSKLNIALLKSKLDMGKVFPLMERAINYPKTFHLIYSLTQLYICSQSEHTKPWKCKLFSVLWLREGIDQKLQYKGIDGWIVYASHARWWTSHEWLIGVCNKIRSRTTLWTQEMSSLQLKCANTDLIQIILSLHLLSLLVTQISW